MAVERAGIGSSAVPFLMTLLMRFPGLPERTGIARTWPTGRRSGRRASPDGPRNGRFAPGGPPRLHFPTPMDATLRRKLDELPAEPGVYLMKDRGRRRRLRGQGGHRCAPACAATSTPGAGTTASSSRCSTACWATSTWWSTRSEKEARAPRERAHQEAQAALQRPAAGRQGLHRPAARPDATRSRAWRCVAARQRKDDGARYFGPYSSASSIRETLRVVNRYFQLRTCTDHVLAHRKRPCILYQIDRCPAPCVYDVPAGGLRAQRGRRGGLPGGQGRGAGRAAPGAACARPRRPALRGGGAAARSAPGRRAQPGDPAGPHGRPGRPGRGGHPPRGARPRHPGPLHARREAPRLAGPPLLRPGVPGRRAALVLPLPLLRAGSSRPTRCCSPSSPRTPTPSPTCSPSGAGAGSGSSSRSAAPRPTCSTSPTATPCSPSAAGARRG